MAEEPAKALLDVRVPKGFVGEVSRKECPCPLYCLALAADGQRAVTGGQHYVYLWELKNWQLVQRMGWERIGPVYAVALAPDGQRVLSGGEDNKVRLWQAASHTPTQFGHNPLQVVYGVAFAPNGRQVVACGGDGSVRLWEAERPQDVQLIQKPDDQAVQRAVAFCPDGRRIVSVGDLRRNGGSTIYLWDLESGKRRDFPRGSSRYTAMALSPDGAQLLAGNTDGTMRLLNLDGGLDRLLIDAPNPPAIGCVAFAPGGGHALSGASNGSLHLWDLSTGKVVHRFQGHTGAVTGVGFSPDGHFALSCSLDKSVRLWSLPEKLWHASAKRR
jgi:WD40 repeat protein